MGFPAAVFVIASPKNKLGKNLFCDLIMPQIRLVDENMSSAKLKFSKSDYYMKLYTKNLCLYKYTMCASRYVQI